MLLAHKLILTCWIVFVAYWLISAWATKKTVEPQPWAVGVMHRIPFIFGALLFKGVPLTPWNALVVPHNTLVQAFAVGICILGPLGAIWSRRTLAGNWSTEVVFKEHHELVERGPYRFVRHPIYTSILLMAAGPVLVVGRLDSLIGFFLFIVGFWIKLRLEESLMLRHFPTQYAAYKSRVKALIPLVV